MQYGDYHRRLGLLVRDMRTNMSYSRILTLRYRLSASSYWLFFFNKEIFFSTLRDPQQRLAVQPALIMSCLALATLMKSSEIELRNAGRARALFWRNAAQAALELACNAHELDYTLAEAALVSVPPSFSALCPHSVTQILALFESSAHPEHSTERANSALQLMDRIIVNLSLQMGDYGDPDVIAFQSRSVPSVIIDHYITPERCSCFNGHIAHDISFAFNPPWDPEWSPEQMRKEECRRICWSALTLIANHTAQCAAFHQEPLDLELAEPAKVRNLHNRTHTKTLTPHLI